MNVEKPHNEVTETPQKPPKVFRIAYNDNANYKHFSKGRWTTISQCFFDLKHQGVLDHVQFSVTMMLLNWAYQNYKLHNFEMSRRELSKIANCGDKQAQDTLETLVKFSLLEEVYRKKGAHTIYRWNVDNFVESQIELGLPDPTLGSDQPKDLGRGGSGLGSERLNTYIYYIKIEFLLVAQTPLQNFVENFNEGAIAPGLLENFNDTGEPVRSPEQVIAAWEAAITTCCRAYGYGRVHLVIKNYPINYFELPRPTSALSKFCRDSGLIAELRERHPHFRTNKEFIMHASKDMSRVVSLYHRESFLQHIKGGDSDSTKHEHH